MLGALQQPPVLIPRRAGGIARRRCRIRNRRVRKPPPTHFHEFRAAGEGGKGRRHLGGAQGLGGKAEGGGRGGGGVGGRAELYFPLRPEFFA